VAVARDCETQALGFPAGSQDYYPAVLGGALALHWEVGGCRVERLEVEAPAVESRIALAYTGAPHHSGLNNWAVYRARLEGDPEVRDRLEGVREAGTRMHRALCEADWPGVAAALAADWSHRRRLGDHISTGQIEALVAAAAEAGALAGKVCGAGGGGCVAFVCEEGRKEAVEQAFPAHGARALPVRLAGPLRVEPSQEQARSPRSTLVENP
jgi:D-glycero-alpha-D-manno-heptose-7-phosphate kinase